MREAIGGGWLFQIVIFFVLLFAGYMALSINYSKAFKVKNEIVDIIERNHGVDSNSIGEIKDYLLAVGYRSTGSCERKTSDDDNSGVWYGLDQSEQFVKAQPNGRYYMCVKLLHNQLLPGNDPSEVPYGGYFRILVFFNMDVPVISGFFKLQIAGDSHTIHYPILDAGV